MTPDQINAAIAETQGCFRFSPSSPNYHGSLDAIVPVVRGLPEEEQYEVIIELCRITLRSRFATPAQWCESYLKAKGLWK